MTLARDREVSVSEPILRFSPLLADADLLDLMAAPPHGGAAQAVAGRQGLSAAVADIIAASADGAVIRSLLRNGSALIRDATLDSLIGRAGDHPDWHEPLVSRPWLPERSARALSLIVSRTLLDTLLGRADIPTGLADEIRERMMATVAPPASSDADLLSRLRAQHGAKPLDEATLVAAARSGDAPRMTAILAITGAVAADRIEHAVALHNAKGLVSLVWRAGFSMHTAQLVQAGYGSFTPGEVLGCAMHGAFPLCVTEMEWQIELLEGPVGRSHTGPAAATGSPRPG